MPRVPRSGSLRRYSAPAPAPPPLAGRAHSGWLQTFQLSDLPASRSRRSWFLGLRFGSGTYTTTIVVPRAPGPIHPTDRPTDPPTRRLTDTTRIIRRPDRPKRPPRYRASEHLEARPTRPTWLQS